MPTHCQALLETGRPVPREEWLEAKRLDRAATSEIKMRAARTVPRRFLSPSHCVAAMAEVMALRAATDGSCVEHDLVCNGFSPEEIARLGPAAQLRALAMTRDRVVR